jgi:integrase
VDNFLAFLGPKADGRVDSLEQRDVIEFRKLLRERGKSASTINQTVSKIVAAPFRLAFNLGLIAANPMAGIPRLTDRDRKRKQAFTTEHVRLLLTAAEGDWKGAIIAGYTTGARLGDVVNLRWENIDFT